MKKILLFLVALVATLSMNAQTTEIHNASGKVAAYLGADVNVKFGMDGSDPTIMVYKGDKLQETYKGSEYKVVSTPVEEAFKAVYDTNGGVNTLTFYYDAVDHSGDSITVYQDGTAHYLFDNAQSGGAKWGYDGIRVNVKKVVINESVKKYEDLTSTAYMFKEMRNATGISGAEYLDVANVTDMSEMFSAYGNNTEDFNAVPNVSGWNTGNVKNMANMFYRYGYKSASLNAVPNVSEWKTDSLTDMNKMFYQYGFNSTSLTVVPDVSGWKTGKVTNMDDLFDGYGYKSTSLTVVPDVSKWNTGNVKNMANMFYGYGYTSTSLTVVPDVSGWNTDKVTNMTGLFRNYGHESQNFNAVPDVSKWNTGNVENMATMFYEYGFNSTSLTVVPNVSKWNTGNVKNMENMFYRYGYESGNIECVLDLSGWNLVNVTSGTKVFDFSPKTFNITIPSKTGDMVNEESKWYYGDGTNSIAPPSGKSFTMFGTGIGVVSSAAGVTDNKVKWVQLWEDGPKFAVCNVGVTDGKAESYGDYFTWANNIAESKWGISWRMPTKKDFQALLDNCTREPIENYNGTGVNGVKFTGKGDFSGNSIFLPAAGIDIKGVSGKGQYEYYWSSTPDDSNDGNAYAIGYNNYSLGFSVNVSDRTYGFSVRAVYDDTKGTAKATIGDKDVDVNWVQLWKDGPKFAEYNVGVTDGKAESYGGYYAWGGSQDKVDDHNTTYTGSGNLTGTDDTATNLWGSNWRMPTQTELQGLLANCDVEWTTVGDLNGRKFTGRGDYASNSVFLPAPGYFHKGTVSDQGQFGFYWSSTPCSTSLAYYLFFHSGSQNNVLNGARGYGYSVRAVLAK